MHGAVCVVARSQNRLTCPETPEATLWSLETARQAAKHKGKPDCSGHHNRGYVIISDSVNKAQAGLLVQEVPEAHAVIAGYCGNNRLPDAGVDTQDLRTVKGLSHQLKIHLILLYAQRCFLNTLPNDAN